MKSFLATAAVLATALPIGAQAPTSTERGQRFETWLRAQLPALVDVYRDLHQHPEITFREVKTSARVADGLETSGFDVTRRVGGLGVVGVLHNGEGPAILLRADMDALPIGERTGLPYASKIRSEHPDGRVEGVMHACGHDIHMTALLGAAEFLATERSLWSGTLVCIGQPAEERGAGARAMLDDGLLTRFPRPDYAIALHVAHNLPSNSVGYRIGPAMANVDSVDITLFGRGGHGAAPHLTIDPVVQAAQLVLQLQTIVSREIDPTDAAVITVGSIHAGTKHNIISDRCALQVTVRSLSDATRARLHDAIRRKANAVAAAAGAALPEIEFSEGTPVQVNDPILTERLADAFTATFGADRCVAVDQVMTGEDFAHFAREGIPSCMFRLGTVDRERLADYARRGAAIPGLHSATYYPDPPSTLRTGVRALVEAVHELCPADGK